MNSLVKIGKLINYLPKEDCILARNFIENRNFEDLLFLVRSVIRLIHKNEKKETPNSEYANLDLDKLVLLRAELDIYISIIYGSDTLEEEDFNE